MRCIRSTEKRFKRSFQFQKDRFKKAEELVLEEQIARQDTEARVVVIENTKEEAEDITKEEFKEEKNIDYNKEEFEDDQNETNEKVVFYNISTRFSTMLGSTSCFLGVSILYENSVSSSCAMAPTLRCTKVHRQECRTIDVPHENYEPTTKCSKEYANKCESVPSTEYEDVPSTDCRDVYKQEYDQQCRTEYNQQCRTETDRQCTTNQEEGIEEDNEDEVKAYGLQLLNEFFDGHPDLFESLLQLIDLEETKINRDLDTSGGEQPENLLDLADSTSRCPASKSPAS